MLRLYVAALITSASTLTFLPLSPHSTLSAAGWLKEAQLSLMSPLEQQLSDGIQDEKRAHWPSLAGDFFERIDAAIAAAKMDPCNAEVLSIGFERPCGFGGRADVAANELQLAAYFNKSLAFCDGSIGFEGVNYQAFFGSSIGICTDLAVCHKRSGKAFILGSDMTKLIRKVDYDSATYIKSASYQALFGTLNAKTLVHVDAAHQEAGLQAGSQYVGVHIRRGDKAVELEGMGLRFNTTKEYAGVVQSHLAARGLDTVYLASDDASVQAELLAALRPSTPNVNVIQCFTPVSSSRSYVDPQGTLAFFADVVALRDAAVFIGTQSSSASRLVHFLRPDPTTSISTDGDWLDAPFV